MNLADRIAAMIEADGPIPVAHYMGLANAHYYATRDPLGAAGDFTTAPEISQMFGELVGLWLADLWSRAGGAADAAYVELGPGRGTLAADALRAMRAARLTPPVHLIETSPVLRQAQADRVPGACWHDDLESLPASGPLLVVANEFFDALPIRQIVRGQRSWHERLVHHREGRLLPVAGPAIGSELVPPHLRTAAPGTVIETSPASVSVVRGLAQRLARQGGGVVIIDYGHDRTSAGETLQAVESHAYADPWARPGERDLTAHVDFDAIAQAALGEGVRVCGPVGQGDWLGALGIAARAAALAKASPGRSAEIEAALARLTAPDQMGELFRVIALTAPDWPEPAGFA
jgi:SAM-dependent MidA family methyltransferase